MNYSEIEMEIIKSFAYGCTPEQVTENYGISVEEANNFKNLHADEIEERKSELKERGYI